MEDWEYKENLTDLGLSDASIESIMNIKKYSFKGESRNCLKNVRNEPLSDLQRFGSIGPSLKYYGDLTTQVIFDKYLKLPSYINHSKVDEIYFYAGFKDRYLYGRSPDPDTFKIFLKDPITKVVYEIGYSNDYFIYFNNSEDFSRLRRTSELYDVEKSYFELLQLNPNNHENIALRALRQLSEEIRTRLILEIIDSDTP